TGHGTEGGQRTVETTSAMDRQVTRTVIRKGPKSKAPGRGSRTDGSRRTFPGTGTAFFSGPPTVCSKNQPFSVSSPGTSFAVPSASAACGPGVKPVPVASDWSEPGAGPGGV